MNVYKSYNLHSWIIEANLKKKALIGVAFGSFESTNFQTWPVGFDKMVFLFAAIVIRVGMEFKSLYTGVRGPSNCHYCEVL